MIKHDFLKIWQQTVILEKNENFKCQYFYWKSFIFDPLPRDRKQFFKILPDFRHRSDQIDIPYMEKSIGLPFNHFAEYIKLDALPSKLALASNECNFYS